MTKTWIGLVAGLIAAVAVAAGVFGTGPIRSAELGHATSPPLSLRLDRHEVRVGDAVTIRELTPAKSPVLVAGVTHQFRRLAYFDRRHKRMIYLDDRVGVSDKVEEVLHGLPWSIGGSTSLVYDFQNEQGKGLEFKTTAVHAGVYLLQTTWTLFKSPEKLTSNPTILIVSPAAPDGANAVVANYPRRKSSLQEQDELEMFFGSLAD